MMKDNSKGESNGSAEEEQHTLEVLVSMQDGKVKKLYHFDAHEKVWTAKLQVINELIKGAKDAVNYGFYDPPCNGKAGKFLEEERLFSDYPLKGSPPVLEFKSKRRVYRSMIYEPKSLQKINSKANQKKFLELVICNAVGQVAKMTEKGIDPNFQDDRTGETPLSTAVSKENASEMIIILVNGGALLDYRTREGLTPVHKAAAAGQAASVKILLDFGASPNYKDLKGLTPLFYTVLYRGDPYCCEILLNDHSELHISDHQGMQEIHLACKNGLVQHLEHLLFYGAQIDVRNASGNTPLHVAALSNQDDCVRVLLFRGAKRNILNYANQSAYEVAAVSGNKGLAELIANFTEKDIVKLSGKPTYSTRRRKSVSKPRASSLFARSTSDTQLSVNSDISPPSPVSSTHSIPSTTASETTSVDEQSAMMNGEIETHYSADKKLSRTFSMSSTASDSSNYSGESDSGELSPREDKRKTQTWRQFSVTDTADQPAVPPVKAVSGAATIRKRLYASKPGKRFVAVRDYRPFMAGELALEKGDEVEVLFVGEKGYWEGRVGNSTGWFHHSYVEEKKKGKKTLFSRPPSVTSLSRSETNGMNHMGLDNAAEAPRLVTLQRTDAGYGFQMRGANSQVPRLNFEPTSEFPALQYFGELEKGGQAEVKGIKAGDFILEVNGEDVTAATHGHVVDLIKKGGASVTLKILTVKKSPSVNGTDYVDGQGSKLPPRPPDRDPSTTLTLGRMSKLSSSSRPSLFEMSMSESSYEEPASYRVDSVIAVSKENRWHSLQRQKPPSRKPVGVQMKAQTLTKRKSTTDLYTGKAGGQRPQSAQSMLPPSYESVVGKRPLSAAVPVAIPHVPSDPRFSRSVSVDNSSLSKYASTSKSTPNLDKTIYEADLQNGHGSPPREARRRMAYNRPFSYVAPDAYIPTTTSESHVQTIVATPVKATVVAVESSETKPEVTVVATPVLEASVEAQTSAPRSPEKPPIAPKPRSLSDALQQAVAARTERMSRKSSETDVEPMQRSRISSAPEADALSSFNLTDPRERKFSAPAKFNPRKKLEASDKVRTEILTSLEEKFVEEECNGDKSPVTANGRFDLDTKQQNKHRSCSSNSEQSNSSEGGLVMASSDDIYRHYTSPTSPTRDMNRQFSFDSSEARKTTAITSDKLDRQLSEPVNVDRNRRATTASKPLNSAAPAPPPPPQIQLSVRANSSKGAVPPPPVILPNASKKDIPMTPVATGLVTADALAASKLKLKSASKDKGDDTKDGTPARKHSAPAGSGDSRHFAVEHGNLLAKAVAARAARISAQSHSETDLSATSPTAQQASKTGVEKQLGSPERNNNKGIAFDGRSVNSRGRPSPPVAPKIRLRSPDLRNRKHGGETQRSLPFDIPAPVLSEEDKSVMLLDEVIRKEAESENWSLNSWNSGSDSSSEIFVPPPVWPLEHRENVENKSRPWYECSSPSEESIPKASEPETIPKASEPETIPKSLEPEKVQKTITTKKGFKIQLTIETKKGESPKPAKTSPQTDYNDIDPVEPIKPRLIDSTVRTETQKEMPLGRKIIPEESDIDAVVNTSVQDKNVKEDTSFELPPPPLLFTDTDEPYTELGSPTLPPPPEFSPREPKGPLNYLEDDNTASTPSSARSDDSDKGAASFTDISSIFSGYARPMEPYMEKPVLDWDGDDVCNWLDSIKMSQYKETFRENDIQGAHLPDLTKAELKELGVKSLGHRMTLENAIARLSQPLESNC